jgi:phthalate 4,5-dioxygenase
MLTREENELLCRVGAEAPMGKMLRRYWIPALMSSELESGGAPKRVRLLGEDLVAFRDGAGRAGILDENCPHRGSSLVLARNEDCGLRCLYHGWKIDVAGNVLETPAEPEESTFKERVRAIAYPAREWGGFVWTYMGPPGLEPPELDFPWTRLPEDHSVVIKVRTECNWVQALEGVIDSAHGNYLHSNLLKPASGLSATVLREDGRLDRPSDDGAPTIEAENTPYGFRYAAIRKPIVDPETNKYVRVTLFIAPIYALFPGAKGMTNMQIFVPLDDEHTMHYFVKTSLEGPLDERTREIHMKRAGTRMRIDIDAEYRKVRSAENNWMQDREAMKRGESFSGIFGVTTEDIAMQESMGPIYDRTKEHLGTSDVAVIRMRRLMLDAVRRFRDNGDPPLGLAERVDYAALRAEERIVARDAVWQSVVA